MSPEEMIDLRNQELRVDEAMVRQLVEEAKADFSENLLEPVQAATSPWGVIRHRRRLLRVMGGAARLKTNGAAFLISVGLFAFFLAVMVYNPVYPWYFDVCAALLLTAALTVFTYVHGGYRQAFSRVYALERRDFTDPGYVTGWVRVYLPSLGFYYRPDVWRGNDGRNGAANPDSTVVLACGVDAVAWTYDADDPDWDSEVWCQVTPGSRIQDFRTPLDYFDLPADHFTTEPHVHQAPEGLVPGPAALRPGPRRLEEGRARPDGRPLALAGGGRLHDHRRLRHVHVRTGLTTTDHEKPARIPQSLAGRRRPVLRGRLALRRHLSGHRRLARPVAGLRPPNASAGRPLLGRRPREQPRMRPRRPPLCHRTLDDRALAACPRAP